MPEHANVARVDDLLAAFRRRDRLVAELWEFDRDLYAVDDFWS